MQGLIQCAGQNLGRVVLQGAGKLWIGGSGSGHYDGRLDISGTRQTKNTLLNTTQSEECEMQSENLAGGFPWVCAGLR